MRLWQYFSVQSLFFVFYVIDGITSKLWRCNFVFLVALCYLRICRLSLSDFIFYFIDFII